VPPPKKSPGNLRARDILKKAKKLSREASFQAMVEAGQKAAAEELEKAQPSRRRSVRVIVEAEAKEGVVEKDAEIVMAARPRGRPKKDTFEGFKDLPRGTVTPSNNRTLKTKKSVAFEGSYDLDLGFKDIPDSANKNQPPKTVRLIKKDVDPIENAPLEEEEDDEEGEDDDDTACAVCNGKDSKKGNEIILCETCDFAVHLKCYDLPKIPKGDWFCRVCQPGDEDLLRLEALEDTARDEPSEIPEIEGLEGHLRRMQTVVLDRLTGQKRIKLQGHDEAMRKVHQVVEQTVLAGEGNSMLVIGARGCGKTTVSSYVSTSITAKSHSLWSQSSLISLLIIGRTFTSYALMGSFIPMINWP
jgi:origin recognition complex subunit 4